MQIDIIVSRVNSAADLERVFDIRKTVFVEEQNCPPQLEWENEEVSVHFLATVNGEDAGACRWRKTEAGYKLERFAVLKPFRRKGVAGKMIDAILNDLPPSTSHIYLHAQVAAMPLYLKKGFVSVGDEFEEAGIGHFKMVY